MTATRLVAATVGVVLTAFIALLAFSPAGVDETIGSGILGEVAPVTEGNTLDGEQLSLRELRGQWVVVNFFATWCAGCRLEHPELVEFSERHAAAGDASVVSVVWDDSADSVSEFFAEQGGEWPVIVGDQGSIGTSYGVVAVPESYLVSPAGRVMKKFVGATGVTADNLDASIDGFVNPVIAND